MKTISVCIPVYNEAGNIKAAVTAVQGLFADRLQNYGLEIIITDNASTDDSWTEVRELSSAHSQVRGYRFSRNFGYQNSVFAGLSLATGDAVVELDADLEDPPEVIVEFVAGWEAGAEVVYGVRRKRYGSWLFRPFFYLFYKILNRLSEIQIPENAGDFRLLDRKVVEVLKQLPERNLYLRGLVSYLGFRQKAVVYDRNPRMGGSSKFSFFHYTALAVDALTAFSKRPLRAIGVAGVITFVVTSLLGLYYLVTSFVYGVEVPGFTTLVVLMLFLHSATFIFLGIVGEYLSRIFDDSKNRPRVIIAECTDGESSATTL